MIENLGSSESYRDLSSRFTSDNSYLDNKQILKGFVSGWSAVAPKDAAAWIDGLPENAPRGEAAQALVARWAVTDIKGAANWLANTNTTGLDLGIAALVERLEPYSPEDAKTWAEGIKDKKIRDKVLKNLKKP
jgi:hypothetical protein